MGAIIRPINRGDIRNLTGQVSVYSSSKVDKFTRPTVDNTDMFHNRDELMDKRYDEQGCFNRSAYIELEMPVMNYFLAGKSLTLIAKLLNRKVDEVVGIANGDRIFDMELGEEVKLSSRNDYDRGKYDREKHVIGAKYIKMLIEDLDIETEIRHEIKVELMSALKVKSVSKFDSIYELKELTGDINEICTNNPNCIWVIGDFYLFQKNDSECTPENWVIDEVAINKKRLDLVQGSTSRLLLLFSARERGKQIFSDQVMDFLVVLPKGYRAESQSGQVDPITSVYNNIISINTELEGMRMYKGTEIRAIKETYTRLVNAVKELMVEMPSYKAKRNEAYKPLAEQFKGKQGLIRKRMIAGRVDYSGRSVIIVDPEMSVDTIGLPKEMIASLVELEILERVRKEDPSNATYILKDEQLRKREDIAVKIMGNAYSIIGRQPTLFYLSIKSFKIKPVSGNAIILNPLCTPSFNADFDGDQMHSEHPIRPKSKAEIEKLMSSTNNLFLPRDGSCHIAPRQEILYGVWKASKAKADPVKGALKVTADEKGYKEVFNAVHKGMIPIDAVVENGEATVRSAGQVALQYALGWDTFGKYSLGRYPLVVGHANDVAVTEDWFKKVLGDLLMQTNKKQSAIKEEFVEVVNRLTKLGFGIAESYPPNVSILNHPDYTKLIDEFEECIKKREEMYNLGFETTESYTLFYSKEYSKLEDTIKKTLKDDLIKANPTSSYKELIESKARGSVSNLMQLFAMKGRVAKNDTEAFNAIIRTPLASQLTGLEHMITAYGSRQGLVDKTVATYEPGYMYRKCSHTAAEMSIVCEDCGTTDGILLDYEFIKQFIPEIDLVGDPIADNLKVKQYAVKLLVDRYVVGIDEMIKTEEQAEKVYADKIAAKIGDKVVIKEGLKLRSILTCKNPCCVKCYGRDLGTRKKAVVGMPIGFIAAQAIGEPGTQMTMKNFQNGGIAGVVNLTSSFDLIEDYMHLKDFRSHKRDKAISHDFISPVAGDVVCVSKGDGTKIVNIGNYDSNGVFKKTLNREVRIWEGIQVKPHVEVGDSIQQIQGDLSIPEIIESRSIEYAQKYLAVKLFDIYVKNNFVSLKHFECVVAGMTFYKCLRGNDYFKVGLSYTIKEYRTHDTTGCVFHTEMYGTKMAPTKKVDVFPNMFMERISDGIARGVVVSGYDSLTNPIVRIAFGLGLGMGTDCEGYLESRGMIDV